MALSHRLLATLEAELNRLAVFRYDRVRRLNGSGSPRTYLRVWLRNDAPIALVDVRGTISACSSERPFEPAPFRVERLDPGCEAQVATIEAPRLDDLTDPGALDRAAIVRFRSRVDLCGFEVSSLGRPVLYAERLTAWSPRLREERKTHLA